MTIKMTTTQTIDFLQDGMAKQRNTATRNIPVTDALAKTWCIIVIDKRMKASKTHLALRDLCNFIKKKVKKIPLVKNRAKSCLAASPKPTSMPTFFSRTPAG
jgi:hypothetical protein